MKDSAAPPRPQSLNNYGCKSSATSCRCLRVGVVFRLDVTNDLICDASQIPCYRRAGQEDPTLEEIKFLLFFFLSRDMIFDRDTRGISHQRCEQ